VTWALHHPGYEAVPEDLAVRTCAAGPSMPFRGTRGIILRAKQEGHLHAVVPILDQIRQAGMHISAEVLWEYFADWQERAKRSPNNP
jgi:predicted nucleic acid-binding protein